MSKIKFTKGELKKQRDALRQYERYLPTLQLKKQQLQLEILHQVSFLNGKKEQLQGKVKGSESWIQLLAEGLKQLEPFLRPQNNLTVNKNIAGVDIPVYKTTEFPAAEYDLYQYPLWIDLALVNLQLLISLREEIRIIEEGVGILRRELRTATQRVNLFEKFKIPEAEESIRRIKIYIGDQMANAVGRSKMAKRKIESLILQEAAV
ncbi:MAG: V-type ATP synthase subunit D [Candidatus Omnitrophota bacterium]